MLKQRKVTYIEGSGYHFLGTAQYWHLRYLILWWMYWLHSLLYLRKLLFKLIEDIWFTNDLGRIILIEPAIMFRQMYFRPSILPELRLVCLIFRNYTIINFRSVVKQSILSVITINMDIISPRLTWPREGLSSTVQLILIIVLTIGSSNLIWVSKNWIRQLLAREIPLLTVQLILQFKILLSIWLGFTMLIWCQYWL